MSAPPEGPKTVREMLAQRKLAAVQELARPPVQRASLNQADSPDSPQADPQVDKIAEAVGQLAIDPGALFATEAIAALCSQRAGNPAGFARTRAEVKATRVVSMQQFDRLTSSQSDGDKESMFVEVVPWMLPVDGAELIRDVVAAIRLHVVADNSTIYAAALWILHTYLVDVAHVSPIANICAPEMRCGKTILLSVLGKLSYRPLQVSNIAPAALFRSIEAWHPTLLIDEVDSFLGQHDEARGIINSGFTRDSAYVIRCVGDDHKPKQFSTWCPKALCGIGKIANTLADRSIPLRLRRKTPGERVANLRHSDPDLWERLRAQITRWTNDHRDLIAHARPDTIEGLNDRANDCWEPLLAIADAAGAEWPKNARKAAAYLHDVDGDTPTIGTQLLKDIRDAFGSRKKMGTAELLAALVADDEMPWATWNHGKPMAPRQLSMRLVEFGIHPCTIRLGDRTLKGYTFSNFNDAFCRYLDPETPK